MFQQRQLNEVYQLIEVSFALSVNPGAITTGSKAVVTVTPVTGGASSSNPNATIALGDRVEVTAQAAVGNVAGLIIRAEPTGVSPGQIIISFYNASAGTITPVSGTYTVVAYRFTPTVI